VDHSCGISRFKTFRAPYPAHLPDASRTHAAHAPRENENIGGEVDSAQQCEVTWSGAGKANSSTKMNMFGISSALSALVMLPAAGQMWPEVRAAEKCRSNPMFRQFALALDTWDSLE